MGAESDRSELSAVRQRRPRTQGLYEPGFEHDACGVASVADLSGRPSHDIVAKALTALRNLDHRGAKGSEPDTGDGAGILTQVPDAFFRQVVDFELPERGDYAVGTAFLPADAGAREPAMVTVERIAAEEGMAVLGWRAVPVDADFVGASARHVMPAFRQVFLGSVDGRSTGVDLDRRAFCARKRAEHEAEVYFPSLSSRTLVYKGMLTAPQLEPFYPDLSDRRFESALALVHSRFSTNTFPSWPLAHPYRYVCHNGEINTIRGNRNWMRARESLLASDLISGDLARLSPVVDPEASDSASLDEVLELLHMGGRSLPHSVLMMIPEAWENHAEMDAPRRAFYEFHSALMEPWDGPALIAFTDGTLVGAVLDRNGLRPGRFWVTEDGLVVLASEVGVLDIDPSTVVRKDRLQPGRMFCVDTAAGRIVDDHEIKGGLAADHPYREWLDTGLVRLEDLPDRDRGVRPASDALRHQQQVFGYTDEELRVLLAPMVENGAEPIGSMGHDSPVAVLSQRPRTVFDYFMQLFAQVTNPPLDAIREELVTSLTTQVGSEQNLFAPGPASCRKIVVAFPVLDDDELAKLVRIDDRDTPGFRPYVAQGVYDVRGGGEALVQRLDEICAEVSAAIWDGARVIVLSDRGADAERAPIPSLLLTGAVHHHQIGRAHV